MKIASHIVMKAVIIGTIFKPFTIMGVDAIMQIEGKISAITLHKIVYFRFMTIF